jgi:hypothetical protein
MDSMHDDTPPPARSSPVAQPSLLARDSDMARTIPEREPKTVKYKVHTLHPHPRPPEELCILLERSSPCARCVLFATPTNACSCDSCASTVADAGGSGTGPSVTSARGWFEKRATNDAPCSTPPVLPPLLLRPPLPPPCLHPPPPQPLLLPHSWLTTCCRWRGMELAS